MKFVFLILLCIPFLSMAQQRADSGRLVITATLTDMPDSVLVAFSHPSSTTPVAQAYSKNRKVQLQTNLSFSGLSRITFSGKSINTAMDIFTGAGTVVITGTLANINKAVVKGSADQTAFKQFIKTFEPSFKKLNDVNAKLNTTGDMALRGKLTGEFEQHKTVISAKADSFIKKNAASAVSPFVIFVLKDLYKEQPVLVSNLLEQLTGAATKSIYADAVRKEVEAMMFGAIGTPAVDFTQPDTAGRPVSLSSFRGKYVLIDFWASWCGPCRMENPNVVTAYEKFKAKNFTVLGVSLDRPGRKDDWIQAIKDDNLTWTNVSDLKFWGNEVAQLYKVGSIPQNYLIDPKGNIIGKNLRGAALEEKLCEVLGCN